MQKHHELHIAYTARDLDTFIQGGMPVVREGEVCDRCDLEIGHAGPKFVPFSYVLNEEEHYFLCLGCVGPVIRT